MSDFATPAVSNTIGSVAGLVGAATGVASLLQGTPDLPDPPPPPEPPAPLPDPEDILLKQRKRRATAQQLSGGLASTILSDSAGRETFG